jgi:hypothetical protein
VPLRQALSGTISIPRGNLEFNLALKESRRMATNSSTHGSLSDSAARSLKEPLPPSRRDLASLQIFLDRDFQDYWEVRRFGRNFGLRIQCPCCGADAPARASSEDIVWYGYRKWRWLANHLVSDHCRSQALTHRHRVAVKKGSARLKETKFAGKKTAAA